MLQKIVFQDNIYQLTRSIDILYEGLLLDISEEYFFDKTVDDLLFFDAAIQKISKQLAANTQISGYSAIVHSLYSCQSRYLKLVDSILSGKTAMQGRFTPLLVKLQGIRNYHAELQNSITRDIRKIDTAGDSHDIVSTNELSELLNF